MSDDAQAEREHVAAEVADLRAAIALEREAGRAFGPLAEACRKELARRGEQA